MADEQDGWETISDPTDVPAEIRKSLGAAGVRKALGIGTGGSDAAPSGGGKLPAWAASPYEAQIGIYAGLKSAKDGFQDDFGGNLAGGLENAAQGVMGSEGLLGIGTPGQRDWWAQFKANDNVIRNKLFGAALTPSEQRAYEATTIAPSMDPKEIRRNLASRAEIVQKALSRKTKFLRAQGYNGEAIDALAGEYAPDFNPELNKQQEGGDPASTVAGATDGSGTPPSDPNAQPPRPEGELTFNDQLPQESAQGKPLTDEQRAALQAVAQSGGTAAQITALGQSFGVNITAENADALAKFYSDPKNRNVAPVVNEDRTVKPVDAGDGALGAAARGVGNALTLGFLDEAGALADTVTQGGTYGENLDKRRGQELYDEQNSGVARFAGQAIGSLPLGGVEFAGARGASLAAGRAAVRGGASAAEARVIANRVFAARTAAEAAGIGGVYGFGDSEGGAGERLGGAAIGAASGAVIGGGLALGGGRFARAMAARRGAAAPALTEQQQALAAADRQGIVPFAPDVGGGVTRRAAGATAQTIGGVVPLRRGAQATINSAEAVRDRVAASIGRAENPELAGETARAGAQAFIARTGARIGRIYDAAGAAAGQARITTPEAVRVLDQELAPLAESPVQGPGVGILQGLRQSLEQPQTVRGLREMRTLIRDEFEGAGLRGSNIERIAGRVVDAATDDIVNGLRAQGLGRAATQYRVADRMWRDRLQTIDDHLEPILGGNVEKSGEQVVQALQAAMKGNNRRFDGFINALPANEQATVRASLIQRLGRATKGQQDQDGEVFSLGTFLTHWDDIGERAKNTLFGADGRAALNDLARYATQAKESQKFANFSNTGAAVTTSALGAGLAAGPVGVVTAAKVLAAQYGAGRLLASPRFARWLARPPRQQASPQATQAYIDRLTRIARSEPAIANDVLALQSRLADAFGAAPARLAAEPSSNEGAPVQRQQSDGEAANQRLQP